MIELLKSLRGRVIIALVATVIVAVLRLLLAELPLGVRVALLAGLIYPMWIPVFQQKQLSSHPVRFVVFVGTGGAILLGLLGMLVWILATR